MDISASELIFMATWFIAAFVNGITGLGGAMVAVPVIAYLMPPHTLIPVSGILALLMSVEMAFIYRKDCSKNMLKWLCAGGIPGLAAGTLVLVFIPAGILQIAIGLVMVLFSLWQLKNKADHIPAKATPAKSIVSGFCAGSLCTAISFAGPPLAVYTLHYGAKQREAFAIIGAATTIFYSVGFIFQAGAGFFDSSVLRWISIGLIPTTVGIFTASPVASKVNIRLFRYILIDIIFLGGISCFCKGLMLHI